MRHGGERHLRGSRCADIDGLQHGRIGLQRRVHLEHDLVLVAVAVDCRDLPLCEGIVQRVVDGCGGQLQPRRGVPVDHHIRLWCRPILVAGDVGDARRVLQRLLQPRVPDPQLGQVLVQQHELKLAAATAPAPAQVLGGVQESLDIGHRLQLRA